MKSTTLDKLLPGMSQMGHFFMKSHTGYGFKRYYKSWQQHLNAYMEHYAAVKSLYEITSTGTVSGVGAAHTKVADKREELRLSYDRFTSFMRPYLVKNYKSELYGSDATGVDFVKAVDKYLESRPEFKDKKVEAKRSGFGINTTRTSKTPAKQTGIVPTRVKSPVQPRRVDISNTPVVASKNVELNKNVPVKLTVGNRVVDVTKLLEIPGVKAYIESEQTSVLKEQNLAKAKELQAQIESLGFDVTLS